MLLDPEKHFARVTAREMAPSTLEQRQRDVYDSHRHRVFSVSYYMTGSEIDAEDLLQGTFIRAFHRAEEPDREIVDASLLEQLRDQKVLEEDADPTLPVPASAALSSKRNILRAELEEAIRFLPSTERLIFLLMDVEGYPVQRVAELLRMTTTAVMRSAIAARIRLRGELAAIRENDQQAA
jgi:RNA polymerase sigma-70 factor (ECF subfamily)